MISASFFDDTRFPVQKTPISEIDKALRIKEAYYGDKQSQNR
jgi:hypothetical protein